MRSFGTEDRQGVQYVPPSDVVYPFIKFRGSDINDLHVHDKQEGTPAGAPAPAPIAAPPPPMQQQRAAPAPPAPPAPKPPAQPAWTNGPPRIPATRQPGE